MSRAIRVLFLTVAMTAAWAGLASADANEVMRLSQCMEDNVDAKVAADIIQKYCNCMNRKMGSQEKRSVTEWEKAFPQERRECDKEAGWR
jgi:hypothetical protein